MKWKLESIIVNWEVFIIYSVYVKGQEIRFSNTCNAIRNYYSNENNITKQNEKLNKIAFDAYINSNKITIFETNYGFTEELVLYNDYVFCFICSNSYKLLFNCLPSRGLFIYNSFPNLNKYQIEKVHEACQEDVIGNIKITLYNGLSTSYRVICSYESFLEYCKENETNSSETNFNKLIFGSFLKNLTTSKINTYNLNTSYGLISSNSDSPHMFNYLYFDKLIIITNYRKKII